MSLEEYPELMPLPKGYKWEYSQDTATDKSLVCYIPDANVWYIQTAVPKKESK